MIALSRNKKKSAKISCFLENGDFKMLRTKIKSIHYKEPESVHAEAAARTVRESLRRKCALRLSFTNAFFTIGQAGGREGGLF